MALMSSPSDGKPTPGRISTGPDGRTFQDEYEWGPSCLDRARKGYNSGMGEIFRKVAAIAPVDVGAPLLSQQQQQQKLAAPAVAAAVE